MSTLVRLIVALIALFFVTGAVLAWFGKIDPNTYIIITGIIGSIASVLGLIALGTPRLRPEDVQNVQAELYETLAEQVRAAKENEAKLALGRDELDRLERERAETELLVRQVSLQVFMEEQAKYIGAEIERRIDSDAILSNLLQQYNEAKRRAVEFNSNIQASGKAEMISNILAGIRITPVPSERRRMYIEFMGKAIDIGPAVNLLEKGVRAYIDLARRGLTRR